MRGLSLPLQSRFQLRRRLANLGRSQAELAATRGQQRDHQQSELEMAQAARSLGAELRHPKSRFLKGSLRDSKTFRRIRYRLTLFL